MTPVLGLVTCSRLPQLCEDDQALISYLEREQTPFEICVWDDPCVDWSRYAAVVLISPWDYPERRREFLGWLEAVSAVAPTYNDFGVFQRFHHKGYLAELESAGVATVPTVYASTPSDALQLATDAGWSDVVLKPSVGLGGRHILRVTDRRARLADREHEVLSSTWCAQPFVESVMTLGETSVVVFAGEAIHAVCKKPSGSDFRVHDGYGGTHEGVVLTTELQDSARAALRGLAMEDVLFARVDFVRSLEGCLMVMEVDVISPCFFFEHSPSAARQFARILAGLLKQGAA